MTALFNTGYLALDDYYLLYYSVPAQIADDFEENMNKSLINSEGIRSPLPQGVVHYVARTAHALGAEDPLNQIRILYLVLGLFSLLTVYYTFKWLEAASKSRPYASVGALLVSFHFIMPFVSTRALIEAMSLPFVMASMYRLTLYYRKPDRGSLFYSVLWIGIASLFRFQDGVMALAIPAILVMRGRARRDFLPLLLSGAAVLLITGLPDLIIRGVLHESLLKYVDYNLHYSSRFGVSPFWTYIPLIIAVMFLPLFLSRFRGFRWKREYAVFAPALLYSIIFIVAHSAIPHKEERFMIPILPLLLGLLLPAARYLWLKRQRERVFTFGLALNFLLLFFMTFFNLQNGGIGLVRFLGANHDIQTLLTYRGSLNNLPISYTMNSSVQNIREVQAFQSMPELESCQSALLVRQDYLKEMNAILTSLDQRAVFLSHPLERVLVRLNPSKNRRRGSLYLYQKRGCNPEVTYSAP